MIEGEWDVYYGGAGNAEEVIVYLQLFHLHIALDPSQFHVFGIVYFCFQVLGMHLRDTLG